MSIPTSEVDSVFVFRPDNLGDVILFSASLRHIRAHFPHACITICVKKYVTNYLELCPYIDRILKWEDLKDSLLPSPLKWLGALMLRAIPCPPVALRMTARLMKQPFTPQVTLFPTRSPTWGQHVFACALDSAYKAGITGDYCNQSKGIDDASEPFYSHRLRIPPGRAWEHELVVTRDFLNSLNMDVSVEDIWPEAWNAVEDRDWAVNRMPPRKGSIILGIAPGAGRQSRVYPPEKLAAALATLSGHAFSHVIFGSESETGLCGKLGERLRKARNTKDVCDLSAQTTIRQLWECLRLCDIVIAADSAALHMATALRKPTLGILGGGHFGRFYPWGRSGLNRVANVPMYCYHCNWKCYSKTVSCVRNIPPWVISEELSVLANAVISRQNRMLTDI